MPQWTGFRTGVQLPSGPCKTSVYTGVFIFYIAFCVAKGLKLVGMNNKEDKNNDLFKNNLFDLGICWAEISMYDSRVTGMVHRLYRDCCLKIFPFGDESYCRSNRDDSISQMDVCSVG